MAQPKKAKLRKTAIPVPVELCDNREPRNVRIKSAKAFEAVASAAGVNGTRRSGGDSYYDN
jgi:hypothetical protein